MGVEARVRVGAGGRWVVAGVGEACGGERLSHRTAVLASEAGRVVTEGRRETGSGGVEGGAGRENRRSRGGGSEGCGEEAQREERVMMVGEGRMLGRGRKDPGAAGGGRCGSRAGRE